MKTHFTADLHIDHDNILKITNRPFGSIEEHNEAIFEGINSSVGYHDRLFILGDVAWRGFQNHRKRIRCNNLHLIIGNHDRANYARFFKTAEDTALIKIQDHKVFLSHYAHAYWPASHRGSIHLYGHTHGMREGTLDWVFYGRRAMDAGVDNAYRILGKHRPFSEDEILNLMLSREGHDHVSWYEAQRRSMKHNEAYE